MHAPITAGGFGKGQASPAWAGTAGAPSSAAARPYGTFAAGKPLPCPTALLPPGKSQLLPDSPQKSRGRAHPTASRANRAKAAVRPGTFSHFRKKSRKKAQVSRFVECKANRRHGRFYRPAGSPVCFEAANTASGFRRKPVQRFPYTDKVRLFAHPSNSHLFLICKQYSRNRRRCQAFGDGVSRRQWRRHACPPSASVRQHRQVRHQAAGLSERSGSRPRYLM